MPIYTKKGDKGETGLFSSTGEKIRVSKDSLVVEAIGVIDEANSFLGICLAFCDNPSRVRFIKDIQVNLFTVNSILAGSDLKFNKSKTTRLEKEIDKIDLKIPRLTSFVMPEGTLFAAHLMYARTLARKAERRVAALNKIEKVHPNIVMYLNRLSDMIFTLFREANFDAGVKETYWKGKP